MRIGVRQQEPLELHGEAVEKVSEFTYLRSIINKTRGTDEVIIARIRTAQSTFSLDAYACVERKYLRLQTRQDFQYECEVCPSVWFGNVEFDETTDQEIAVIYQQVFKEDPEYPLAIGRYTGPILTSY